MRRLGFILIVALILSSVPANAAFWGNIPQTTMQIAREAGVNEDTLTPSSKLVRVGIGTNGFSTYEWDSATIYATGEFEVYNNKTYINTFDGNSEINISMVGHIFVLTDADGKVIEKVSGPIIFKTDFGYVVQGVMLYTGELCNLCLVRRTENFI